MNDATATPPERPRGVPTDAQLLDWLRRGAVAAPDGTVIGWITPVPPDAATVLVEECRRVIVDEFFDGLADLRPLRGPISYPAQSRRRSDE